MNKPNILVGIVVLVSLGIIFIMLIELLYRLQNNTARGGPLYHITKIINTYKRKRTVVMISVKAPQNAISRIRSCILEEKIDIEEQFVEPIIGEEGMVYMAYKTNDYDLRTAIHAIMRAEILSESISTVTYL